MNEESLVKYVKALPDKMLSEYEAAVAGGGTGAAVNAAGTKSSGVRDNKNRFPFLGPLLVIIAAVVTVAVVVVVQSRNKKSSTDPSATAYQLSEPTTTPDSTEFVTDLPETGTAATTELPTATTELPAATFTPAPTDIATTPAPTDTATLPAPTEPETRTPDPSNILDRPFCIIQNGRKIYPYYAGELRTPKHSGNLITFVDNLPEDLSQIKANAPIVYTDVPFTVEWTVEPYSQQWVGAKLVGYEFDLILEKGIDNTDTNKLNMVFDGHVARFDGNASGDLDIMQLLPKTDYPGRKRYMALIIHDARINDYEMLLPSYVFCFVNRGSDTTPTPQPTATPTQDPDHIKVNHLDPVITKGELYVGETVQLSYHVTPENYNYGTIRWKLTSGFDCATIDPVTGVLTALKPGSVGILPYVEEYETKNSPAGIVIYAKEDKEDYKEPEHEQELPAQYRPDAGPYGDAWTEKRVNIRKSFLVYNCQTPDDLPSYKLRPSDNVEYRNSPYENDLSLFVMFRETSYSGDIHSYRAVKQKGVKVTFTDAKTGKVVGYSYTNADGIAMFTIKKQEIDFIVTAELNGYNFDHLEFEEDRHIIYPGGGERGSTGPYTNCGIAQWYDLKTNSNAASEYTFRTVNVSTGEVIPGGIIDIYFQESTSVSLDSEYGGYTIMAFDDFFDSIRTITYLYGETYPKKRVENCTFRCEGNIVTVYADIPDDTPTQIRIERVTIQGTKPTLYVAEGLELTYTVYPANANYGTVKFRLTRGEDCAFLDPDTGRLVALKEGSFAVEAYVEEYEITHPVSPQAIQVIDRLSEPQHERPLPDKYKPDELVFDGTMDESIINRRKALLVYNCATPDVLPVYMTEGVEYHTSPYGNDYIIYVNLYDAAKAERDGRNASIVKKKGIPVYFMEASTGEMVGYSYTNADGIAMFTIKKQESLDLVVSVEMDGYTTSFPHPAEQGHIIPGQSEFIYARAYVTSGEAERFLIPIAVDF